MATSPADPAPAPAAIVEPPRPRMHSRLPSLDQLRASANSKLGNLPTLSTTNLAGSTSSTVSPAGGPSSRLNRSLLARKESISSINELASTHLSSSPSSTSPSTTTPTLSSGATGDAPGGGGGGGTTPTNATPTTTVKDMGSAAPERWKAVPTLSEIRQRVAHARTLSNAGGGGGVGAVKEEAEGEGEAEVKGAEGPMGRAMARRKGPVADLARKAGGGGEEENPPPTPVPEYKVVKEEHPLGHAWTMTYSPPLAPPALGTLTSPSTSTATSSSITSPATASASVPDLYTASLLHLGNFTTIEAWARLSNHLAGVPPSCLSKGGNYHLFKKGVRPVFEDPANEKGGRWTLTLRSHPRSTLDHLWRETVLLLVGEALEPEPSESSTLPTSSHNHNHGPSLICGAVVSVRAKSDRIQLWVREKEPVEQINAIGRRFVKALGLEDPKRSVHEEGGFGLEFQFNHGSVPLTGSKYITLSSASVVRPAGTGMGMGTGVMGAMGTPAGVGVGGGAGGGGWRSGLATTTRS